MARAVLLSSQIKNSLKTNKNGEHGCENMVIPLFDTSLKCVGELVFGCFIVTPFNHPLVSIGGNTETYWKSATVVASGTNGTGQVHSMITSSSLAEEYIELVVQYTKDGKIVIFADWIIESDEFQFSVSSLTYEQGKRLFEKKVGTHQQKLSTITSSQELVSTIYKSFLTLDYALKVLQLTRTCHRRSV
jgi:hypothetical protein